MRQTYLLAMPMLLAWLVMAGMSAPVFAEPGVIVPRGPVLSARDPVFLGLLISPGTSKCRRLGSYYDWKCTYGSVPRSYDRFGKANAGGVGPGKTKQTRAAKSAKR